MVSTTNPEKISSVNFKVAVQKSGELTQMALAHLAYAFDCPEINTCRPTDRKLFSILETYLGTIAIIFARNADLPSLVSLGAVDASIVGTDTVEEYGMEDAHVIRTLSDGKWDFVYASPESKSIPPQSASMVATSLPRVAARCLENLGNSKAQIFRVNGSVEIMPYLELSGHSIDGICDISVSGASMRAQNMQIYNPPLTQFEPVLVGNGKSERSPDKKSFFISL